jgi:transposase
MRLNKGQWSLLEPLIPRPRVREDKKGRPRVDSKSILEGILWVLKSGARWRDLPKDYPSYQTCHRRFQSWVRAGLMENILQTLVRHLEKEGVIDLTETYIDGSYVDAKKKVKKPGEVIGAWELKSWQLQTVSLFQSPYPLEVLHTMRVNRLIKRFGVNIQKTFLCDLSETKLTIMTPWMKSLQEDIKSNSLLPIGQIEHVQELKMEELLSDTKEDGLLSDFYPG